MVFGCALRFMPNRILREGCLDSERVDALSEQAENFYKRLFNVVDDYGRFEADPIVLLAKTYPRRVTRYTPEMIEGWLRECSKGTEPLVVVYRSGKKRYLQISDFRQRVRADCRFPPPPPPPAPEAPNNHLSDTGQASAGLTRATTTTTTTHTPPNTTKPAKSETTPPVPEPVDDPEFVLRRVAHEMHRTHPVLCSRPLAETALLLEYPKYASGKSAGEFAKAILRTHAQHALIWKRARDADARAYVPHLHVWIRDGLYLQTAVATAIQVVGRTGDDIV